MSQTLSRPHVDVGDRRPAFASYQAELEDDSPFGLQGLTRETCKLLKPNRIHHLAAHLSLKGTREQIQDRAFVNKILSFHEDWQNEYRVVHLIEKSLWIDGRSDLVMTLLRNPSQIPDNPPRQILQAMSRAITWHPDSTVWYGVPLFSERTNVDGLPIPLTAAEVREEAERRITTAQQHALRWGWAYRAALALCCVPPLIGRMGMSCCRGVGQACAQMVKYWKRAQRDARNRSRAKMRAHSEYCRMGQSFTKIPDHTTMLGRMSEQTTESIRRAEEIIAERVPGIGGMAPILTGLTPLVVQGVTMSTIGTMMVAPMTIIACDPFLFIELPEEPNKLRFLGHWYWQDQACGQQKLHLHV